jgi:hypothetical protein
MLNFFIKIIMRKLNKITFYHSDNIEALTLKEISEEAGKRGYETRFTKDFWEKSQIGFYCSHQFYPVQAKLSCVMLHDLGQKHIVWPSFWKYEPWPKFDIGFLPGQFWADLYEEDKEDNLRRSPRYGIYKSGWPKSDYVFRKEEQGRIKNLRKELGFKYEKTILYAPSWENNNKQDDFVIALKDLDCNLLIKQAHWPENYPQIRENIKKMRSLHEGNFDNVFFLDWNTNIMDAIALSDILVSEESGVMVEAMLLNVPSIAVKDWVVPDTNPPRMPSIPYDFVKKSFKKDLKDSVISVLKFGHKVEYRSKEMTLEQYSDYWFSNKGYSAKYIIDTVEELILNKDIKKSISICAKRATLPFLQRTALYLKNKFSDLQK